MDKSSKRILSENDRDLLDEKIAETEKQTNAQVVLAVVKRSDSYPEIPWKAFAIGVTLSGLIIFVADTLTGSWVPGTILLYFVTLLFGAGIVAALLSVFCPAFSRLFLPVIRRDTETLQCAMSLFLSKEIFTAGGRRGILLFISQYERKVIIIPDTGVKEILNEDILKDIIKKMAVYLRKNKIKEALETGLAEITSALTPPLSAIADQNQLPDEIIERDSL